jgi:diguanylate cyclase
MVRVICLTIGWLVLLHRARTGPGGERRVWRSHAAAIGVLALGSLAQLGLEVAEVPGRVAVGAFSLAVLPACVLLYRGLAIYHRVHSATGEGADWLVGLAGMLTLAASANLLLQQGVVHTHLESWELQYRVLSFAAGAVVVATLVRVSWASGVLRTWATAHLVLSMSAVVAVQVWVVLGDLTPPARVVASFAWIAVAWSLAHAARLGDALPRPIATSPLSTTTTVCLALLTDVAVVTATTLQPGDGGLRASVLFAVLAVLALAGRITRLVRGLVTQDRWRREAATDELTGLANRRSFAAELRATLASGRPYALLMVDLDRFKEVNDRHGHATGDRLLQHVARGFRGVVPPGSVLARLGGDEFAVVLRDDDTAPERAVARARELAAVVERFPLDGVHVVGSSVGVVTSDGRDGLDEAEVLRRADAAMYAAKSTRAGVVRHDEAGAVRRARLTEGLVAAFGRPGASPAGFTVHHSPQTDLATGVVCGVEALVRWHHAELGEVAPEEFGPLAEERGLVLAMTRWTLRTASADRLLWRAQGHAVRLTVAVPGPLLGDPGFLALVEEVGPDLVLRVSEASLLADRDRALRTGRELAARGCTFSLDDFGASCSSLVHLADLPVAELTLHRSFAAGVVDDRRTAAIVRGTVDLAHHLGLRVVAEGVEDAGTLAALRALGCDVGQGFRPGTAVPAPRFWAETDSRV